MGFESQAEDTDYVLGWDTNTECNLLRMKCKQLCNLNLELPLDVF